MLLYETMMEDCVMQDKTTTSDGLGGFTSSWQDGAHFRAAIVKNQTIEALVAEKQGVTELYTITVDKGVTLDFHDVLKRVKDGLTFRVTSNIKDSQTPKVASFQFGQVTAERWDLP